MASAKDTSRRTRATLAGWALLLVWACKSEDSAPLPSTVAPPSQRASVETVGPAPTSQDPRAEVTAAVLAWAAAQNAGTFSDYETLYAGKFYGVKLSKNRKKSFDRAAWLEDRKSMFKRPFTVTADKLRISGTLQQASVTFRQSWKSATYSDVGDKRLLFVNEGSEEKPALRIAQEEMLSSDDAKTRAPAAPSPLEFSFVRESPAGLSLIVRREVNLNAIIGTVDSYSQIHGRYVVHRPLSTRTVPGVDGSLIGRRFDLYGASGKLCTAQISRLAARASMTPHWGQELRWHGQGQDPDSPQQKASDQQIALDIWRSGGRFTAAELSIEGDCTGALWARASDLPEPTLFQLTKLSRPPKKILAALRSRPGQRSMAQEERVSGRKRQELVQRFIHPSSGAEYFHYVAHDLICGDGLGQYWELLQGREDSAAFLTSTSATGAGMEPLAPYTLDAVVDLEGDGELELIAGDGMQSQSGERFVVVVDVSVPYFDCPC